ncbi:MAG: matrixin family metalloprotease [Gemmatimonadaceae bacterium]|nr:matrixin family metalloprotease [Gemmatimonadaceae bacterium]NUQ94573.1 matrixin family metalloprotease [Gemmatimonadaceae bacterium]NUR20229.1 matrixin family metalloprotease [Gemmatimonadaceae bacterium]NUS97738.1 matrixin family metalloprotease [Gemmatimonadaceae bacterium]
MKQPLLVASLSLMLVVLGSAQAPNASRRGSHESSASGSVATGRFRTSRRDAAEIKRRLQQHESGTYIGEILLTRDSALARWHDRVERPLKVWIQPASSISDWRPEFLTEVRDAFLAWSATGIPVRFLFVGDSSKADIHVHFINQFNEPISGKTRWARDDNWWIVDGDITLAVHHDGGEPLDRSAVRAIALHEVGHLLGLDHTSDIANIMTPRVRVRDLSSADRSTMELLYSLPPGPVR